MKIDKIKNKKDKKNNKKAIKYNLIEIVEASANILQHILAKDKGIAAGGI